MALNWKIWAPVGIVVVAALVIGIGKFKTEAPVAGEAPVTVPQDLPVAASAPATGNVDDAVAAVLAGVVDDVANFADAAKDADLVGADSQTITNLGQSSYANEI